MADENAADQDNRIRKLRKKLRQIENLQRLCGVRELSSEEAAKVMQRDVIRVELQELLSLALDEPKQKVTKEEDLKSQKDENSKAEEQQDQDECKMESDDDYPQKTVEDEEQVACEAEQKGEDVGIEESPKKDVTETPMEQENETDDKKVQKKQKNTKKKENTGVKEWKNVNFSVKIVEGHEHPVCAVDSIANTLLSGGHDTSLKVWSAENCEETFSLGGHTGSITSAYLVSEKKAITGSQDCSIRVWDVEKGASISSTYVYNPVTCLAHKGNILAIGNEGGKIEIYGIDDDQIKCSTKAHDEAVVCIKFMDQSRLASASSDGIIKVFEISQGKFNQIFDSYDDISGVAALNNDNNKADTLNSSVVTNSSLLNVPLRRINCIAAFKDIVFWGDDGFNIKALNIITGQILKLRNNLSEFSPTDALAVLPLGESGFLFSAGFDIDNGHGYINVRKLPSMDYLGTISDDSLGHVSCISPSLHDGKIRIVTGGSELRVWEQQIATNSKKRRASDEIEDVIPCKFNCSYNNVQDSENEDEASQSESEQEAEQSVHKEQPKQSWCVIQ